MPKRLASISTAFFLLLSPALADVTYVVAKGDNLYHIARRTWPDEYRENPYACVKRIVDANSLRDPGSIFPGDELVLPGVSDPGETSISSAAVSPSDSIVLSPAGSAAVSPAGSVAVSPSDIETPSEGETLDTSDVANRDAEVQTDEARTNSPAEATLPPTRVTWVVQRGQTPGVIAGEIGRRYGCTISWRAMLAENGIDDPRKVPEGMTLTVSLPADASPSSSAPRPGEAESLLGVGLEETASAPSADVAGSSAAVRADLLDLGLLREYRSQTDATELRLAVRRIYHSATYKTFRGTVATKDDGSLEIRHSSRGDVTAEVLAEVERQKRLRDEARRELGEHFDRPADHPDFPKWLREASAHLTRVSGEKRRLAIMQTLVSIESSGGSNLVSTAGCIGVGQLAIATADEYGVNPWSARENLVGAAKFINDLIGRFGGSLHKATAYYNAGSNLSAGASYARRFTAQVERRAVA